ncbi:MAG: NADH:flavin oxidoreductase [Pseudomonadales bacterium]|nr:NADH:flavin oxidoreductase [Pseudomonadales bacterium]
MSTHHSMLFKPTQIGAMKLRNKLAVAPMTRVSATEEGVAAPEMKNYYQNFARGGFGLIITEGLYTDQLFSQGYRKQPGMTDAKQAQSWQPIIDAVHRQQSVIIAQLMHAGALSQYNRFSEVTKGPSCVRPIGEEMSFYYGNGAYRLPAAMNEEDIQDVIQGFAASAVLAKAAGFDGVEIHGANGYLLDQFLTPYTNHRNDGYGGSLTNRLSLYQEIIQAVRDAVGENFIIGVRFSQKKVNDTEHQWADDEMAAQTIFTQMRHSGVDYIHTAEPVLSEPAFAGSASLAALAKQHSGLPVIANGGIKEPALACHMLEQKHADVVALGTAALANQDWPNVVKASGELTDFDFAMLSPIADLASAKRYFNTLAESA